MVLKIGVLVLAVLLFILMAGLDKPPTKPVFILAGGGALPQETYDKFICLSGGKSKIVVIPSGMENPYQISERWSGCKILHPNQPEDVFKKGFAAVISEANGVWFLGGNQKKLADLYKNTPVEKEIKKLVARGGVLGGTSAGATIYSEIMVYEEGEEKGLDILDFIIDQHFSERKRLPRLLSLLKKYPGRCGIGIDESTALVICNTKVEVMGEGCITICDGENITQRSAGIFELKYK